jgi:hypothetical protein
MDKKGKAKKKLNVFLEKSFPAPKRSKALGSFIGMLPERWGLCWSDLGSDHIHHQYAQSTQAHASYTHLNDFFVM